MTNPLREAIERQGAQLSKRAEWLQGMIERQVDGMANRQKAIDKFTEDLRATNLAIDALRDEYKNRVH